MRNRLTSIKLMTFINMVSLNNREYFACEIDILVKHIEKLCQPNCKMSGIWRRKSEIKTCYLVHDGKSPVIGRLSERRLYEHLH